MEISAKIQLLNKQVLQTAKPSPPFWKGTHHYFHWPQEHWGKKVITNLPGMTLLIFVQIRTKQNLRADDQN